MSDLIFRCCECRGRLVVDDSGAGLTVPCPVCSAEITIPLRPACLPAINEALRAVVQEILAAKIDQRMAGGQLKQAIQAAGYSPESAFVERDGPEDLLLNERIELILKTNVELARSNRQWTQAQSPEALEIFPCWELIRLEERNMPRDWESNWGEAANRVGDTDAAAVLQRHGRMIARKDSPIWASLSRFGTPYPPFDFNSGMWTEDVDRDEAVALGVVADLDVITPQLRDFQVASSMFVAIEDQGLTDHLWEAPQACPHCGSGVPKWQLQDCDACAKLICVSCQTSGCSGPVPPPPPCTGPECVGAANLACWGLSPPFSDEVAASVLEWCDRAFGFGFSPHQYDFEARAHRLRGEAFESRGELARAIQEYELAVGKDPRVGLKRRLAKLRKNGAVGLLSSPSSD